ncbi:MAG: hypothetical protein R3D58_13620 [Saprospiraceae bacterium]
MQLGKRRLPIFKQIKTRIMKTLSYAMLLVLFLIYEIPCEAQKRVGFFAGTNISSMRIDPPEIAKQRNRLIIGGFGSREIGRSVAYRYGLQYIGKGADLDGIDANLSYVELLFGLQVGASKENGGIYLVGGFGIGLLASARGRVPSVNADIKELFQAGELSYHGGIGIRIKNFFVEGLYQSSLISVVKDEYPAEAFNQGIQLKAGLSFELW